jgi:alpha-ketoglutarate-dependent taurine dioxygenase
LARTASSVGANDGDAVTRFQRARFLSNEERSRPTSSAGTPLVIEPSGRTDLARFIEEYGDEIAHAIFEHGAVLLRGFAVHREPQFAAALNSSPQFRPMTSYFLSEPGREAVADAPQVFGTNSQFKTGGGFNLGGFHSEGYFGPDVPALLAFWCKTASWTGGETALVNMANAYQELSEGCRERLEGGPPCVVQIAPLDLAANMIGSRYGLSEASAREFCIRNGLTLQFGDRVFYGFHKPSVFVHPITGRRSLQINLAGELPEIDTFVRANLRSHYATWRWLLHRLVWRYPAFERAAETYEAIACRLSMTGPRPRAIAEELRATLARLVAAPPPAPPLDDIPPVTRLHDKLIAEDIEEIANAVCRHCSMFPWKEGDVLVLDNLQTLHAGMPGYGPRELRVMMLNPVPITFPVEMPMIRVPASSGIHEPFSVRVERLRGNEEAPSQKVVI